MYQLDRFARNRYDSAMYKNILKKHNIKVVSIKENISDNPEGIILESKITSTGGHVLLDVSGVTVFVEGGADNIFYKTGDRIRVTGIVETYGSSKEISVGASGSISLIE